jgi:hypothetical protein
MDCDFCLARRSGSAITRAKIFIVYALQKYFSAVLTANVGTVVFLDALYMETGIDLITLPSFWFLFVPLPCLRTLHFISPRPYTG